MYIISGGGTGGHIYPAIAIANEIKKREPQAKILFVGASDKMEMQKVPQAGYPIVGLWIAGLQRKLTFQNALFPIKLLLSLVKSYFIIKKHKPKIVIGTGGFASGAILKMANLLGIPTLIQEQNSYPGITNKLLANKASKICVAYPNLEQFFPKDKILLTGNPVRQDILNLNDKKEKGIEYYGLDPNKKTLVILGGSLGARQINQLIEKELEFFRNHNLQIIWQCGKLYYDDYEKYNQQLSVLVLAFVEQIDLAYAAADFIISRAGASSVSELCLVGKPVVFIPSPNVAEDHQTKNAQAIVNQNGAILIKEKELDETFETKFTELLTNQSLQTKLSINIKKLALPNATKNIVDEVMKIEKK